MKMYSLMIFYICLNMGAFIINQSGAFVGSQQLYINPLDISNQFSLTVFGGLVTGGAIVGIIALITRQYVYASIALVIWVMGLLLPIAQWFLLGTPILLNAILPSEISYLSLVVSAFFTFIFFMFMVEIATQRQIT